MAERRGLRSRRDVAAEIGIDHAVYHRLEAGTRRPSGETALKLARWLGWTAEQVIEGARVQAESAE